MALILLIIIFIIIRMYLLTNVIIKHMIPMLSPFQLPFSEYRNAHAQLIPRASINEYTYENGVQFEIKSL